MNRAVFPITKGNSKYKKKDGCCREGSSRGGKDIVNYIRISG